MTAARVRARGGRRCRASASAPTSTGWRASWGSAATCSTTSAACCSTSRAPPTRSSASSRGCRAEAPPLARIESVRVDGARRRPGARASASSRAPAGGEPAAPVAARRRHVRRLPGRAVRPGRPPLPLPVRQLHQLRPALHDRARRALRPAADDDGRLRDVRALPGGVRRPAPTAASTRSPTPARSAGRRCACGDARRRRRDAPRPRGALLDGAIVAVKGLGGYHLACRADDEAAVARLRARKHREDQPFALMARDVAAAADAGRAGARPRRRCWPGRERPIVLAPRRADAPRRRGGRAAQRRARRDAALLAAAPPAGCRRRRRRW